ncbi:hypothetical protein BN440_3241 [Erwinia amylovora MR1]|nr:hypothetical protein BN440_3241 [Erwinia amylovora MR1]
MNSFFTFIYAQSQHADLMALTFTGRGEARKLNNAGKVTGSLRRQDI